jgi:hypothetical protein
MMTPDEIIDVVSSIDENVIQFSDLNDALIGWADPWNTDGSRPVRLVYSAAKCLDCLMNRDGMTEESAMMWLGENLESMYVGAHSPIIMHGG